MKKIAELLLKRGMKNQILEGDPYPSVFKSVEYMDKLGWLKDAASKAKHSQEISDLKKALEFYKEIEKGDARITQALAKLK